MEIKIAPETERENHPKECVGVIGRFKRQSYWDGDSFVFRESFKVLRKKTCKGCPRCEAVYLSLGEDGNKPDRFPCTKNLADGDTVQLYVQVYSTCWETGYADDLGVEMRKVKPCTSP